MTYMILILLVVSTLSEVPGYHCAVASKNCSMKEPDPLKVKGGREEEVKGS